jgi:hypothetical protein
MLKSHLLLLIAVVATSSPAFAEDEIHWTMTGPGSVTVDWRGASSTLSYGLTTAYGQTATASTPSPLPFSSPGPFWEARITGLTPGAVYHYSIAGGPDHVFHPLLPAGSTFTVYVEGDVGDTSSYSRVGPVQSLIAAGAPSFVLVVGDLTYANPNGQATADNHFNNVMKWSLDAAYMPAWGNHEWDVDTDDDFRNYKGRFDLPNPQTSPGAPSAGCCGEDWYWFDCGNVRFIAYPEPFSGAWSDWNTNAIALMDAAQANPAIRFIVTFGHRPAYSSGSHPGSPTLVGYLDALGASHSKYILNLNGHSHDYERTYPQSGVTHVTVGIGGSALEESDGSCLWGGGCPAPAYSAFRAFHHGVLRLTFTPTGILGEAICGPPGDTGSNKNDITCSPGNIFDSFSFGSGLDVPSLLVDATRLALESVQPNPAVSALGIAYVLGSWAPASLELIDVAGRPIVRRDLGSPGPGRHEARMGTGALTASGVYWLRLTQNGRSVSSKVTIIR